MLCWVLGFWDDKFELKGFFSYYWVIREESFGDCLAYDEVEIGLGGGFDKFRLIINVRSSSLTVVHTYKWMNIVEYICCQVIVLHTADIAFQVASNIFTMMNEINDTLGVNIFICMLFIQSLIIIMYLLCVHYDFSRLLWKRSKCIFPFKAPHVRMPEPFS